MDHEQFNAAVTDLALTIGLLARRMRVAGASHDLSWSQRGVIARLATDGPATISDLARAERVKPQSMGASVAVLEEMRLVERRPHPTDGRQFNIVLTAKGVEVREQTRAAKRTWLAEAISQLNKEEQQVLFKADKIIKRMVEL
jgi:DNA-binding MarR family transcriptional regulator